MPWAVDSRLGGRCRTDGTRGFGRDKSAFPHRRQSGGREIIARAPNIGTLLVLLFQPLAACVVTLVLAVLNPYDDLGVGDHPESGDPESGDPATEAEQTDDEVQPKLP
ncbi:hypothetical protein N806_14390 [Rhodococcus sp. P27]|nr:hypothetical protein N806_14390 [Rhodococcus sp. P27]